MPHTPCAAVLYLYFEKITKAIPIMHVMQKDNKSREIFCALAVLIIITIKCGDWIYYKPCILQVLAAEAACSSYIEMYIWAFLV